jgi:hypothetical protein
MEAAKKMKDPIELFRGDANAIVANGKDPLLVALFAGNVDARGLLAAKFNRIGQKVLKQLSQLSTIALDARHTSSIQQRSALFKGGLQIRRGGIADLLTID